MVFRILMGWCAHVVRERQHDERNTLMQYLGGGLIPSCLTPTCGWFACLRRCVPVKCEPRLGCLGFGQYRILM